MIRYAALSLRGRKVREILIDDKILFLDHQLRRRKMYSKETSRIVENTLISYLDRNISALKNGERFEVLSRNTGINYCNLVSLYFCTREQLREDWLQESHKYRQ